MCVCRGSNNSLSSLPDDFLSSLTAVRVRVINLSRNRFTAASLANLPTVLSRAYPHLDLSFNHLGPSVPAAVMQSANGGSVSLMSCGITDVAAGSLGSNWEPIDLSLNDLRHGLHPLSFSRASNLERIGLCNCNLRSDSLMPGVFDGGPGWWNLPG